MSACYAALLMFVGGCTSPSSSLTSERRPHTPKTVRDIRVRLAADASVIDLQIPGPYEIRAGGKTLLNGKSLPATELRSPAPGRIQIGPRQWKIQTVEVITRNTEPIAWRCRSDGDWSARRKVSGKLELLIQSDGRLEVINEVDLETYLVGVLVGELYADFQPSAFEAGAVVARTYALYEMSDRSNAAYDVTATEASQVYLGAPEGPAAQKAKRAVERTRGIVCAWPSPHGKRIFPTFYSSACGGMTQAAANVKPGIDAPTLSGGVPCNYCRIGPRQTYRWNPVRMSKSELLERLRKRYGELNSWGNVARVDVSERTSSGRPLRIHLLGDRGETFNLRAEDFRLAVGSREMRSTNCKIVDEGATVLFTDGRGFGHGMGLCQWGMQGQALSGKSAAQILKYYYPGVSLVRAY